MDVTEAGGTAKREIYYIETGYFLWMSKGEVYWPHRPFHYDLFGSYFEYHPSYSEKQGKIH